MVGLQHLFTHLDAIFTQQLCKARDKRHTFEIEVSRVHFIETRNVCIAGSLEGIPVKRWLYRIKAVALRVMHRFINVRRVPEYLFRYTTAVHTCADQFRSVAHS